MYNISIYILESTIYSWWCVNMNKLGNLFGFRTNKLWKKLLAILYYLFCINFVITSLNDVPEINVNLYDMIIYRIHTVLMSLSYLIPVLFISNFKFKDKIPLLKNKKWWTDILGFIILFIFMICFSNSVILFHSNEYTQRYEEFNATKIIFNSQEGEKIFDEENTSLPENELENNFEDLVTEEKNEESNNNIIQKEKIKIHYIDVDQGDSIFIELPNNTSMLIDAGETSKAQVVINYINALGYDKINYLIGTHPHSDHIGGLADIINNFEIGNIYMPKAVSTSKTYENLLNTILQKKLKIITAKAGTNILDVEGLKIDIIAPNSDSYTDLNNYSAVVKIIYQNRKFLFMGDAETKSENEIISDVSADVIKIGHHGSNTSSGQIFVNRVKAKYVIVTVGANNKYDHPHESVMDRWKNVGATIYRTDLNGNIVVISDGNSLDINTSK